MDHIGRQVRKGFQNEEAAGESGMGDLQPVRGNDPVVIEKNVEIDGPGRPIALPRAPEVAFYRFEEIEEAFRLEIGFDFEDAVEEIRLGRLARLEDRFSLIKRRNTSDVSPCVVKTAARSLDVLMTVSLAGTDTQVNDGHL